MVAGLQEVDAKPHGGSDDLPAARSPETVLSLLDQPLVRLAEASHVTIADWGGKVHWQGKTDTRGQSEVRQPLSPKNGLPGCFGCCDGEYVVTAKTADDCSFTFSNWQEGISPWRFNLPHGEYNGPYVATTVFDRTLLRAGETVNHGAQTPLPGHGRGRHDAVRAAVRSEWWGWRRWD